jgi:hypothetical protein
MAIFCVRLFLSLSIVKNKRFSSDITGCYDALDFSYKGFCCQREDDEGDEDVEKIFLQLAKSTKEAHYIKASRKLAKVFIDNVYSTETERSITLPLPK